MTTTTDSQTLHDLLNRIGLQQYFQVLLDNGFDDWPTVLDITEADLAAMGFKLGHRRTLQREIATFRGYSRTAALPIEWGVDNERALLGRADSSSVKSNSPSETPPGSQTPQQQPQQQQQQQAVGGQKRKYRRHPKPDENAPRRPKTAYGWKLP